MVTGASAQRSHDVYDSLGSSYVRTRREDRRIAARILAALGDARTVVNVGAGAGSYEPRGLRRLPRFRRFRRLPRFRRLRRLPAATV